jgi:hypothetical protein
MRPEQVRTVDGKTIEVLVPQTEADIEELRRRQQQGEEFDDRFSFGDYHERPPRRRRRRRPCSPGGSK